MTVHNLMLVVIFLFGCVIFIQITDYMSSVFKGWHNKQIQYQHEAKAKRVHQIVLAQKMNKPIDELTKL